MEKIAFYYTEKGAYAPKEGLPFVKRDNIAAIINYQNEFLFLGWNHVDYDNSLVTGGVDDGEELLEATKREVIEETGYYDFDQILKIDCVNVSKFFVEHKNQNRFAKYYPYLVILKSLQQQNISTTENEEHSYFWVPENELNNVQLFENHRNMLEAALELKKKQKF